MTQLTIEQKAKRYDVLEQAILKYIEERYQDDYEDYDNDHKTRDWVAEHWMDKIDGLDIPEDVYMLFDKILYENVNNYMGEYASSLDYFKKRVVEFDKRIGG